MSSSLNSHGDQPWQSPNVSHVSHSGIRDLCNHLHAYSGLTKGGIIEQAESVHSRNASLTRSWTHAPREVDTDDPFLLITGYQVLISRP